MNVLENNLVKEWRTLIFETENQLKKYEEIEELTFEEHCILQMWEQFLADQRNSLKNYVSFINRKEKEDK